MAFLIAVVALHHARRLELGEGEGIDEFFKRHAVLQADRDRDGEVVHHRPEAGAFLVHVDENLAELAVLVFAGAQIDLVTADDRLLGVALAPLGHLFACDLTISLTMIFSTIFSARTAAFSCGVPLSSISAASSSSSTSAAASGWRQFRAVAVKRVGLDAQRPDSS